MIDASQSKIGNAQGFLLKVQASNLLKRPQRRAMPYRYIHRATRGPVISTFRCRIMCTPGTFRANGAVKEVCGTEQQAARNSSLAFPSRDRKKRSLTVTS